MDITNNKGVIVMNYDNINIYEDQMDVQANIEQSYQELIKWFESTIECFLCGSEEDHGSECMRND